MNEDFTICPTVAEMYKDESEKKEQVLEFKYGKEGDSIPEFPEVLVVLSTGSVPQLLLATFFSDRLLEKEGWLANRYKDSLSGVSYFDYYHYRKGFLVTTEIHILKRESLKEALL